MHKYLSSIGFQALKSKKDVDFMLLDVLENYDSKKVVSLEDHTFVEISKEYAYDCGITICGEYDQYDKFQMEYYFPYFLGSKVTTHEDVVIERHAGKESFAGACDDLRVGISLIFYLSNAADFLKNRERASEGRFKTSLTLSALANEGKILMPIQKDFYQIEKDEQIKKKRTSLIMAARNGDEEAMENLTMDDMDVYTELSTRIQREDLYSIVDTCFMPHGIECDQYTVLGEITEVGISKNTATNEKLYQLSIVTNGLPIDVCIPEKNLLGIPEVGRRFKGDVWLQGIFA